MLTRAESVSNVVSILGDQTDVMFSFFRDGGGRDESRTAVVGAYDVRVEEDKAQNYFFQLA